MFAFKRHPSAATIPEDTWNRLMPGEAEDWAYYRAAETALPDGFTIEYLTVERDGEIVCVAPLFHTRHYLQASIHGTMRRLLDKLAVVVPWLLSYKVTGLGSPVADRCHLGIAQNLTGDDRIAALDALYEGLAACAAANGSSLLVVKDLDDAANTALAGWAERCRFGRIRSLPNVYLELPFESWEAFLKSHKRRESGYIRRKEQQAQGVTIETTASIAGLEAQVHALFEQTREQSGGDYGEFEKLHPDFFGRIAEGGRSGRVLFQLGRIDGELVSFLMLLRGADEVVWNFIGMKYPQAREHNLYFVNVNHLIRYCIANRVPRIRLGNTSYGPKLLYGGRLAPHWILVKHRSPALNWFYRFAAPHFDYEKNDAELKRLKAERAARAA